MVPPLLAPLLPLLQLPLSLAEARCPSTRTQRRAGKGSTTAAARGVATGRGLEGVASAWLLETGFKT